VWGPSAGHENFNDHFPIGVFKTPSPGSTLGTAATLQTTSANDWVQGLSCPWDARVAAIWPATTIDHRRVLLPKCIMFFPVFVF